MDKVFVYGTLKAGYGNNYLLRDATFVSAGYTHPKYDLYDLGPFPAVKRGGNAVVHGELYEVTQKEMDSLDLLEGYPNFYNRELTGVVDTEGKRHVAWIYYMDNCRGTLVESGNWE